jgi:hypothetical protein
MLLKDKLKNIKLFYTILSAGWALVLVETLLRPEYQTRMFQMFIGPGFVYPSAVRELVTLVSSVF